MSKFWCLVLFGIGGIATAAVAAGPPHQIEIGRPKTRALWTPPIVESGKSSPAIILIPGTGPHGPEFMAQARTSEDGKPHSLARELSAPFVTRNWAVLSLGKPGVDFFKRWNDRGAIDPKERFYNSELYENSSWADLVLNLGEAVEFVKKQSGVDPTRILVLAHSSGTQVASDYAKTDPSIAGYILLGYYGRSFKNLLEWQFTRRIIENFVSTDVDTQHRQLITPKDTEHWPAPIEIDGEEYRWPWSEGIEQVTYPELEKFWRESLEVDAILEKKRKSALYRENFERPEIYKETAAISSPIYAITGSLDVSTPVIEVSRLREACDHAKKNNCFIKILPGIGHGLARPKPPRRHPLLDLTIGPVDAEVLHELEQIAVRH